VTTAIIAALVGAFGLWRVAAGLHYLGVIRRKIPGYDLHERALPAAMRASASMNGGVAVFGGLMFLLAAVGVLVFGH
jgi:hypothetical protein